MKSFTLPRSLILAAVAAGTLLFAITPAQADPAEAADRAFAAAAKYSAMGYYMSPSKEGHGGFGVTLDFEVPVSRGLDYTFIVAGDRYCQDVDIFVEAEETGNTIVKDTRRKDNGLAGVRWRSDYNGNVTIVVSFARVTSRCGWCALVGRRGTVNAGFDQGATTAPGASQHIDNSATKPGVDAVREGK